VPLVAEQWVPDASPPFTIRCVPRLRLGVVLLIAPPHDREIDGLRRALDDSHIGQVPPHLTLVPPVNVRADDLPAALRVLRSAAASLTRSAPLALTLGPPTSFRPATDTLYLAVSGSDEAMAALMRLRDAVFVPPFERRLEWPFVPHVTISEGIDPARIDAAVEILAGYQVGVSIERVHLLHEQRDAEGRRGWRPLADAPLAAPAIVGRGGIELELTTSQLVAPDVSAFVIEHATDHSEPAPEVVTGATTSGTGSDGWLPSGAAPLVIAARHRGEIVGMARGWTRDDEREITWIVVAAERRGQGIARQLRLAFAAAPPQR